MFDVWRVVFTLHRDTGLVSVRAIGEDPAYSSVLVPWWQGVRRAVELAGYGATIRVRVVVPAVSGTFRCVNQYRMQLPRQRGAGS